MKCWHCEEDARASCANRCLESSCDATCARRNLIAKSRPVNVLLAFQTEPMPPSPSFFSTRYRPKTVVPTSESRTTLGIWFRNLAMRTMNVPAVADWFLARELRDDIELPDYAM